MDAQERPHVLSHPDTESSIRRVLENLGVQHINEAENGRQATDLLERKTSGLLLTDYVMPEMDGRELYGATIGGLRLPTLFILEGGYAVEEIGLNVVNVLQGYEGL